MSAEAALRLAWEAHRDGRPGRRDALLTLALAIAGTSRPPWARRVLRRLVARRPDHHFARFAGLESALADPAVARALEGLRAVFPPARVRRLLDRAAVGRGPYRPGRPALAILLDDLLDPFRPAPEEAREADRLAAAYLAVLAEMAHVLALTSPDRGARAA